MKYAWLQSLIESECHEHIKVSKTPQKRRDSGVTGTPRNAKIAKTEASNEQQIAVGAGRLTDCDENREAG